jgi:hypothetical protein
VNRVHASLEQAGDAAFDPPNPLKKGEQELKVPLFKGDLGESLQESVGESNL